MHCKGGAAQCKMLGSACTSSPCCWLLLSLRLGRGAEYCVVRVCMSVCLSVRVSVTVYPRGYLNHVFCHSTCCRGGYRVVKSDGDSAPATLANCHHSFLMFRIFLLAPLCIYTSCFIPCSLFYVFCLLSFTILCALYIRLIRASKHFLLIY